MVIFSSIHYSCNNMPQYCIHYNCNQHISYATQFPKLPAYCSTSWLSLSHWPMKISMRWLCIASYVQRVTRLHGLGFAMPMCKEAHCCWFTGNNDSYRSPRITNTPYILLFYLTNTIASLVPRLIPYYAHATWGGV